MPANSRPNRRTARRATTAASAASSALTMGRPANADDAAILALYDEWQDAVAANLAALRRYSAPEEHIPDATLIDRAEKASTDTFNRSRELLDKILHATPQGLLGIQIKLLAAAAIARDERPKDWAARFIFALLDDVERLVARGAA